MDIVNLKLLFQIVTYNIIVTNIKIIKYFNQRWTFNPFFTDILIKNGLDIQVFISKTS